MTDGGTGASYSKTFQSSRVAMKPYQIVLTHSAVLYPDECYERVLRDRVYYEHTVMWLRAYTHGSEHLVANEAILWCMLMLHQPFDAVGHK